MRVTALTVLIVVCFGLQERGLAIAADLPPLAKAPFNSRQAGEFQQQWAEHLGRPRVLTNSVGMKMVLLPPGEFRMGISEDDAYDRLCASMMKSGNKLENEQPVHGGLLSEMPAHPVRLNKPFYMGECEVTVAQFRQFADATGYQTDAERGLVYDKPYEGKQPIRTWRTPIFPDRPVDQQTPQDNDPVMHLDWNDCMAFSEWLSRQEADQGFEYSLPTSAEWEYACRAGTTTVWYFGNEDSFDSVAPQYEFISWKGRSPRAVRQGKPNPFGLYDMHGNMMEWMKDWLHDYYYLESPVNDPVGPESESEERNKRRMVRGGAFEVGQYWSRSSWFVRIGQGSNQHRHPGFRVAIHIRDVAGVAPEPEPDLEIVGEDRTPANPEAAQQAAVTENRPKEVQVKLNEDVSMAFVLAPAGSFLMGSKHGGQFERPVHQVEISRPFYIGKYEVTQQQYDAVMGEADRIRRWGEYGPIRYRPRLVRPDMPMHHLNWNDWQEFIAAIQKKVPGREFRLPTEAEWEYACRAGSRTEYCYGDDPAQLAEYASFCADDAPRWSEREIPDFRVGQRMPNNWGIHDMHGNVREWCSDWWDANYYRESSLVDPQGPERGRFRVLRGGTIRNFARFGRSAFRFFMLPNLEEWNKAHMSGARLVIALPSAATSEMP